MRTVRHSARRLLPRGGDEGITLIESMVAMLIAGAVFLALAGASMAAIKATLNGRANQQVGDFLSQQLETVRAMGYSAVAMRDSDLTGDSDVTTCGATKCFGGEPLVLNDAGSVYPHVKTVNLTQANNLSMTLYTYVSRPVDGFGADYKRVTVVAKWNTYGQTHTRTISTIVTETQRGLPLPIFKAEVQGIAALSVNPGSTVTYVVRVTNQGARDTFNLTKSDARSWSYYFDTNGNGAYDSGVDTPVTDTNGDGVVDTGMLEPNTAVTILMVRTIPSTATAGVEDTTFTFTSVAQPSASTAVKTVAVSTTIVIGAITASPTPTPTPTPTSTTSGPSSDCAAPSVPVASASSGNTVYRYYPQRGSTNPLPMSRGGLPTLTTEATTSLSPGGTQAWSYTVSNPRPTFAAGSTAVVSLWVGTASPSASLQVQVYTAKSSGSILQTLGTMNLVVSPFTCAGYQQMVGSMTVASGTSQLPNSGQLVLNVTNTGSGSVTLVYDATVTGTPAGRFQSYLDLGSNR